MFQYTSKLSKGEMVTYEWLTEELGVPFEQPTMLAGLVHLEDVYDSLDLYLWLRCVSKGVIGVILGEVFVIASVFYCSTFDIGIYCF